MKLAELSRSPELIKIVIDDKDTLKEFKEAIEFWTWDRQPMDVFIKLANAKQEDLAQMIGIIRTLILDETGQEIIKEKNTLPNHILVKSIAKIVAFLGK